MLIPAAFCSKPCLSLVNHFVPTSLQNIETKSSQNKARYFHSTFATTVGRGTLKTHSLVPHLRQILTGTPNSSCSGLSREEGLEENKRGKKRER